MKTLCTHAGVCRGIVGLLVAAAAMACSGGKEAELPATPATTQATATPATDAPIPPTTSPYDALPEPVRLVMDKPFTGDFDALVKRRAIRSRP